MHDVIFMGTDIERQKMIVTSVCVITSVFVYCHCLAGSSRYAGQRHLNLYSYLWMEHNHLAKWWIEEE